MRWLVGLTLLAAVVGGCAAGTTAAAPEPGELERVDRIAFGSCADESKPQPIWDAVVEARPDVFVFLGDNVYADTRDMTRMRAAYAALAAKAGYRRLVESGARIIGTWDDHDYGENDAGKEYPRKREAARIMLDFFGVPDDSPRRQREGVYGAYAWGEPGRRVQIILLDTRYFRDPLPRIDDYRRRGLAGPYPAGSGGEGSLLGEAQWRWLQQQLRKPADLRFIASSIQFVATQHGWEKWANFPAEHQRMIELIDKTQARGVLFISGDRHFCEISRLPADRAAGYPLYDITSSGLTNVYARGPRETNDYRIGEAAATQHFGQITIDWAAADPTIAMKTVDVDGQTLIEHTIRLSALGQRPAEPRR